ncbi:MAG TPA: hypothetical protein VMC79_00545 [Rectinemataceae bacterium]|nr:hypothetical protein [Rectinemataceae bacterium]
MATAQSEARRLAASAHELGLRPRLPGARELSDLVEAAIAAERSEPPDLRPRDSSGQPGGLICLPARPTILVPDIHARPVLLSALLAWTGPEDSPFPAPVAELLADEWLTVLCVGDVFHSEAGDAARRWQDAYREYAVGWSSHGRMDEEMSLTLSAVRIVLDCKAAFPRSFHYLKGNHDNVSNDSQRGDRPFYKFVEEGEMVRSWFDLVYGAPLRGRLRELELDYPVLALGDGFVASHGEPAFAIGREDVIEYRSHPEVVHALIWTPNDGARPGSVSRSLDALLASGPEGKERSRQALWFGGHRPVDGPFALRAGGRYVQFHNPQRFQVACLLPGRPAEPRRDIYQLMA